MVDLLGPGDGGAINAASVRPTETTTPAASDTWCQDCVGGVPGTGTSVTSAFMNRIIANLRSFIRGAGTTESNASDDLIKESIRRIVQDQRWVHATTAGSASAWTASISPAPTLLFPGMRVQLLVANGNSAGAFTFNLNGLGAQPVRYADGTTPGINEIVTGQVIALVWDGTFWRIPQTSASQIGNISLQAKGIQIFTASGTFTVPNNVTSVDAIVIGGGGSGGASGDGSAGGVVGNPGAGGGGGGFARKLCTTTPGASVAVTVGAGGTTFAGNGNNGTSSSFGAFCSASGGAGGVSGINTTQAGGAGGTGTGGTLNITGGQGGSSGHNTTADATQSNILNLLARGGLGAGGFGTVPWHGTGGGGIGYGSGGNGASGGSLLVPSGGGAPGLVILSW